jgi:hypothetical protein
VPEAVLDQIPFLVQSHQLAAAVVVQPQQANKLVEMVVRVVALLVKVLRVSLAELEQQDKETMAVLVKATARLIPMAAVAAVHLLLVEQGQHLMVGLLAQAVLVQPIHIQEHLLLMQAVVAVEHI